jgi:GrpB-like predicted nucleotidyltransferase (UPF0157 family)
MTNNSQPSDFGLNPRELRLVTVGPEWAQRFASEQSRLLSALGLAAIDVQHIGSTAVPGILAKPILDIAVAIENFESGHLLVPIIIGLGYEYRGEYGISRRHYFVQGSPKRTHHLHVLEHHTSEWRQHICFKEYLLSSPTLAAQYSDIKREIISESFGNRGQYQTLKSCFISQIFKV